MSHTFHKDQGLSHDPIHRHAIKPDQRQRARLTAARYATGPEDLAALLAMLDLMPGPQDNREHTP